MQKKKWTVLGIVCLLGAMLMGCGGLQAERDDAVPASITVWHYYNGVQKDAFERLVNEFNATEGMEQGILVTAESKGDVNELADAVMASADKKVGSEELPNIFATYMDTALLIKQKDLLADISQYMTEEELASYVPGFLEEGKLTDAGLDVLPIAKSTELLFLNATEWDIFAGETGAGESAFETWEGLAQVAEDYYNWSGGKAFFGRDAFANYLIVGSRQLGSPIFEVNDGQVNIQLDTSVMRRLWDCYAVPYLKGYYGAYGRFRSDDIKTGDLVACVGSTSSVTYYPKEVTREDGSTYPITIEAYDLPDFANTPSCAVSQGAGMAVISSEEETERAAVTFLKWFTDVERNTKFCVESGYFPVKTQASSRENMLSALAEADIDESSLNYHNMLLTAKAVNERTLYNYRAFNGGTTARDTLTCYMTDVIDGYAAQLQKLIDDGMPREDAWENYITDELFQSWLQDLQASLETCIQ